LSVFLRFLTFFFSFFERFLHLCLEVAELVGQQIIVQQRCCVLVVRFRFDTTDNGRPHIVPALGTNSFSPVQFIDNCTANNAIQYAVNLRGAEAEEVSNAL